MAAYKILRDYEGLDLKSGEIFKFACCDCGLVHDIAVVIEGKMIGFAVRRNKRATAQKRRHLGRQATHA